MADLIALRVGGYEMRNFTGYAIGGDLFTAADSWSFTIGKPTVAIRKGMPAQLYVNGKLEMTGVVDTPVKGYNRKDGTTIRVQGRDLMGLVVDTHCEEFRSLQGVTLKRLAEYLLYGQKIDKSSKWPGIPFLDRKAISVPEAVKGGLKKQKKAKKDPVAAVFGAGSSFPHSQIQPGMTVHQVLSQYAASRGLLYWCAADGTMTFGIPKARSEGEVLYTFTHRHDGRGNNIENAALFDDASKRYSRITVVAQTQAAPNDIFATQKKSTVSYTVIDDTFPFRKPYVTTSHNDSLTPRLQAKAIRDAMRRTGWRLDITVSGHSQNGHNYRYNELCRVYDEELEIDGVYLVYGRTLEKDRKEGTRTHLQIGLPREDA